MSKSCIAEKFKECVRDKCGEQGCYLNLEGFNDRVILKGEPASTAKKGAGNLEKSGDYILFIFESKRLYLAVTECKRGDSPEPDATLKKLNTCVKSAIRVLNECELHDKKVEFFPIVLSGAHHKARGERCGKKLTILFREKNYNIIFKKCGHSLTDIIKNINAGI